ncbi:gamma-glutamyltransferase family protein [Pseudonocardia acaciae]|uniref:gamma-glutamyltransferase family protein n=1 Tax=Pseudonocardia acaciae TaxID=551276 RepID=UPI000687B80B|nr:gamma-glutamyltransferase family protein [Pseudonocardia acaciae]
MTRVVSPPRLAPFGAPTPTCPNPGEHITAVRGDRGDAQWPAQSRSELVARHGVVTSSHPIASQAGLRMLQLGGTAADAAIATCAALGVLEPESAGLGSDLVALYHDPAAGLVTLDATGPAPAAWTPEYFARANHTEMPRTGPDSVTVPGAVRGWAELHGRFGRLDFARLLEPAIELALDGFGVSELVHRDWQASADILRADPDSAATFLVDGQAPELYSVVRNPGLARALRLLQGDGPDAFYSGPIGRALADKVRAAGGALTLDDLGGYRARWAEPLSVDYRGYQVCQAPPSTQGFAVLEMLAILRAGARERGFDLAALGPRDPRFWHLLIETKKLAFADLHAHGADPDLTDVPVPELLSDEHATRLCHRIDPDRAASPATRTSHDGGTVYLAAADRRGAMVSFIASAANGTFGSGLTVPGHGFALHSRGMLFSLRPGHPNRVAPGKRPFTTIIPGFVLRDGLPVLAFGNMGGHMQPQAQVTELVNMIDLGMNPQAAGDAARFLHDQATNRVELESELYRLVGRELATMGHDVHPANGAAMGGYQAIHFTPVHGVYRAAADHRKDGAAVGW